MPRRRALAPISRAVLFRRAYSIDLDLPGHLVNACHWQAPRCDVLRYDLQEPSEAFVFPLRWPHGATRAGWTIFCAWLPRTGVSIAPVTTEGTQLYFFFSFLFLSLPALSTLCPSSSPCLHCMT